MSTVKAQEGGTLINSDVIFTQCYCYTMSYIQFMCEFDDDNNSNLGNTKTMVTLVTPQQE